jgi:hypothetical protein
MVCCAATGSQYQVYMKLCLSAIREATMCAENGTIETAGLINAKDDAAIASRNPDAALVARFDSDSQLDACMHTGQRQL